MACNTFTWIDGNTYTSSNNTASHTLINAGGCDSLVTLDLTINYINSGIVISGATLTANLATGTGISYNWLDCDNNFSPVGVTTQSFTPSVNGNYSVELMDNQCTDTSICMLVTQVGFNEKELGYVQIVPNPTEGYVTLNFESSEARLRILDFQGKEIEELIVVSDDQIDMSSYEDGVYLFVFESEKLRMIERVIKY